MMKRKISVICSKVAVLFSVSLQPMCPAFAGWNTEVNKSEFLDETELRDLKKLCKKKPENQQQEKWSEREKRVEYLINCTTTLTLNAKKFYLFDDELQKAILYSENPNIQIELSFLDTNESSIFAIKETTPIKESKNKEYQGEEEEYFHEILSHKKSRLFQKEKPQLKEKWHSKRFSQDFSESDLEDEINEDDIAFMEIAGLSKAELQAQRRALENFQQTKPVIEEKSVTNNNSYFSFSNIENSPNGLFISDFPPTKNNQAQWGKKEYTVKRTLFPRSEMTKEEYDQSINELGIEPSAFGGFAEREKDTLIINSPTINNEQFIYIEQEMKDLKVLGNEEKKGESSGNNSQFDTSTLTSSTPMREDVKEFIHQLQTLAKDGL